MSKQVCTTEVRLMFDLYDNGGRQLRTYTERELQAIERLKGRGMVKYTSNRKRAELTQDAKATCWMFTR